MPVREIHECVGPEEGPDSAMEPGAAGGGNDSPRKPSGQLPKRFQNLSLIDSISYLLPATESKAIWRHWAAQPATPANGLLQSGPARDICETCWQGCR